jgi:hypothetical protein
MLYHRYIQKKLLHQCIKILYFNSTFESRNNYTFTSGKTLNKKKIQLHQLNYDTHPSHQTNKP